MNLSCHLIHYCHGFVVNFMGLFLLVYDLFSLFIVSTFITQDTSGEVKKDRERKKEIQRSRPLCQIFIIKTWKITIRRWREGEQKKIQ